MYQASPLVGKIRTTECVVLVAACPWDYPRLFAFIPEFVLGDIAAPPRGSSGKVTARPLFAWYRFLLVPSLSASCFRKVASRHGITPRTLQDDLYSRGNSSRHVPIPTVGTFKIHPKLPRTSQAYPLVGKIRPSSCVGANNSSTWGLPEGSSSFTRG